MATFNDSLGSLIASVVSNFKEINSYIRTTDFILEKYGDKSALHSHDPSTPFEYLREWRWTPFWDEYFSYIMNIWDEKKMTSMQLNTLVGRLSGPASTLDLLVPKLEKECQRFPKVPESVVRNAREMRASVTSFLDSADKELKGSESAVVENEIRQRRPITRQGSIVDDSVSLVKTETTEGPSRGGETITTGEHSGDGALVRSLTSDNGLMALTGIVSIISCLLQGRAYSHFDPPPSNSKGGVDDPDFYNAMQTFLLQTLALYTALAPAIRSTVPRYDFWVWLLSFCSFGLGIASLAVYPFSKTLTLLLACISNCLQAFVTLALIRSIGRPTQVGDGKREV